VDGDRKLSERDSAPTNIKSKKCKQATIKTKEEGEEEEEETLTTDK
jgi:hypothetical protein